MGIILPAIFDSCIHPLATRSHELTNTGFLTIVTAVANQSSNSEILLNNKLALIVTLLCHIVEYAKDTLIWYKVTTKSYGGIFLILQTALNG